jgi:hypothetical protein
VSNKDVKQDALDNLADALTEDLLNTPDDERLREVEEDYGDPRALARKFDQILERAEKQVFETARSAASPQVQSSVLDLLISLRDETIRRVKGILDLGSRLSEFLSSLRPTLAWSATAAAVVIFVQAAVITALLVKEPPMNAAFAPDVFQPQFSEPPVAPRLKLSDGEIAALVAGGRQLMVAGDIPNARLLLQQAAEAGSATAALELGATYDPTIIQQQKAQDGATAAFKPQMADMADIRMARLWYEKALDLGSTEAAVRLEKLRSVPNPSR